MLDYATLPEQRQSLIRERLRQDGRVLCIPLAQELGVSEHTIRRDLQELAHAGLCKRVYGGAVSTATNSHQFLNRLTQGAASKAQLGRACASLIRDGSTLFLDAGTTNLAVAQAIPETLHLTVITNTPSIAVALMAHPHCEVILLGGHVDKTVGGVIGVAATEQLQRIHVDQCFLGACALDAEAGLTTYSYDDAAFKKVAAQRSHDVVIAVTGEKIPAIAHHHVLGCDEIHTLVVEPELPDSKRAPFLDAGIHLVVAGG